MRLGYQVCSRRCRRGWTHGCSFVLLTYVGENLRKRAFEWVQTKHLSDMTDYGSIVMLVGGNL